MVYKFSRSFIVRFFVLSVVLSGAKVQAETLLFYEDYWPFSYTENAETKGLYFDFATAVFERMQTDYQVEVYPFKRSLILAMAGKGIVVGIFKTDERVLTLDFSEPFYQEESVLFVNKTNAFAFNQISDLAGKQVGVKLGWSYGEEFDRARENALFATTVGSAKQIYQLLDLGRLDAVVDNKLSGISTVNDLGIHQNIEALSRPLVVGGIHIAVKKGTHSELIKQFNRHVSHIREDGEYQRILTSYYAPDTTNSQIRLSSEPLSEPAAGTAAK